MDKRLNKEIARWAFAPPSAVTASGFSKKKPTKKFTFLQLTLKATIVYFLLASAKLSYIGGK